MRNPSNRNWTDGLAWLAARPRSSAWIATGLLALLALMIRPPVIEGSMLDQISGSNEGLEVALQIAQASGDATTVAVIVRPKVGISIAAVFDDLATLRQKLASASDSASVRSIDSVRDQLFLYDLNPDDSVHTLTSALRENPLAQTIISADALSFLVVVSSPGGDEKQLLRLLGEHHWDDVYSAYRVLAGLELEQDIAAGLERDLRVLIPVAMFLMLLALWAAFGGWRALLLPVFASIASAVVTFALFSAANVTINLVTLLALPIVLIVGLANSCHFLARSDAVAEGRQDIDAAVAQSLQRVGPPFFFSSLTTAIALASLGLNDFPPIANLGRLSAGALVIVYFLVLLAAPLSLRWYLQGSSRSWQESGPFLRLSAWLARRRAPLSAVLLLVMVAGAVTVPLLSVKSDPRSFFPDDSRFSSAIDEFEKDFYVYSPLRILVSARSDEDDPLLALQSSSALRGSLEELSSVRQVALQPAQKSVGAFVLTALLSEGDELPNIVAWLDKQSELLDERLSLVYSSALIVYNTIDEGAIASLSRSLAWSLALIFGAILLVFRSPRAVFSTVLANGVPLAIVCGGIWLIGDPLNLVTLFVFLVALGVIVDDSIHILFWRSSGVPVGGSSIEFSVLLSTALLCLGLLVWQFSDFPTTRQFAGYCALALGGAVFSNLTVLPYLLGRPINRGGSAG
ncbi:MAG: MMPL family transporter [Gammaproteobacteria bacterium]|nr:MMPL family transporter [Gammaproteobacteria bacterium]MDH3414670.1 MMPL family transporter [Gammaproteobacteria bacterium]